MNKGNASRATENHQHLLYSYRLGMCKNIYKKNKLGKYLKFIVFKQQEYFKQKNLILLYF